MRPSSNKPHGDHGLRPLVIPARRSAERESISGVAACD
jgi:hypothetical protein